MASFYEDASLVVIPSGYKTSKIYAEKPTDGSGDLTFTRASGATRVASNGLIEKVRTNLVLQSQTIDNASWAKTTVGGSVTVTANYGAAPDGTNTADRVQISAPTAGTYSDVLQTMSVTSGVELTYSVYLKSLSGTPTIIFYNDGVTGNKTATLTSSWARYTFTVSSSATQAYPRFLVEDGVTSASADFLAWGAQLEYGVATAYIPTTTAAVSVGPVSNVPRLDYLNSTCPRLLLEPQRTNSQIKSENFASWLGIDNVTISSNTTDTLDPSGYNGSDKITLLGGAPMRVYEFTGSSAGTGTISLFVKAGTTPTIALFTSSSSLLVNFNLSTQVVTPTTGTGTITSYGNGWYRITATATLGSNEVLQILFVGSAGQTIYIWGAQCEAGAYATSYIPTLGTSVTRVADVASKTSASALIGQTEGTMFVDFQFNGTYDSNGIVAMNVLAAGGNEAYIFITGLGQLRLELYVAGALQAAILTSIGSVGRKKIAFAYKANDFVGYMNGVQIGTDTSGTVGAMSTIYVGTYQSAGYANGNINQALLFKTRLSNSDLATLTTL